MWQLGVTAVERYLIHSDPGLASVTKRYSSVVFGQLGTSKQYIFSSLNIYHPLIYFLLKQDKYLKMKHIYIYTIDSSGHLTLMLVD
jgi:hypothetical protein